MPVMWLLYRCHVDVRHILLHFQFGKVFPYSNGFLIFLFLLCYSLSVIAFGYMVRYVHVGGVKVLTRYIKRYYNYVAKYRNNHCISTESLVPFLFQGHSNRYGLYGQSCTGFWLEHKLLVKKLLINLKTYFIVAGINSVSDLSCMGDVPNQLSNSDFKII